MVEMDENNLSWQQKNRERSNAYKARWRRDNPELDKAQRQRYRQKNKEKINQYSNAWKLTNRKKTIETERRWIAKNPEKMLSKQIKRKRRYATDLAMRDSQRNRALFAKFGITAKQYDEMLLSQGGKCKICNGLNANGIRLSVDHDHTTGRVRGLLCNNCNLGIGYFMDNVGFLGGAIDYLQPSANDESITIPGYRYENRPN